MDLDQIRELVDLLIEKDVAEFELENQEMKVKIRRTNGVQATAQPVTATGATPAVTRLAVPAAGAAEDGVERAEEVDAGEAAAESSEGAAAFEDAFMVKSPMVGTFYRAPEPGAEPYVDEGDMVDEGQTLCIVEAMKLMNEITAEMRGEVLAVLVENGQPIEYGQELFALKPL